MIKKGEMQKGFKTLNKHLENKGRYIASCESCDYFYPPTPSSHSQCNNKGVTRFDMAEDTATGRVYCTYWIRAGAGKNRRGIDL